MSTLGTGENSALPSNPLSSNLLSQCAVPPSAPHMARHSLPSMLSLQAKPPRPKSSLAPASTTALGAPGSGSRAASPYSNTGSYTSVGKSAYDVYMASTSAVSASSGALQQRAVSRRQLDSPAVSSTSSAYPHVTTALPMRKETSPSPSCQLHLSGGGATRTVDTTPVLTGHRRAADSSPGPLHGVVQGGTSASNRGRVVATAVRSSSARQLVVSTRATVGTRVSMTPPPRLSAGMVHVGAVNTPMIQVSGGRKPATATAPALQRALSPDISSASERVSPGQAFRQVPVPRLRSPKSWEGRNAHNNVPSTTRTNDEEQDWAEDDFISHRRSSPEHKYDRYRNEQAPSEPERSPEERFPDALPEVINCREPFEDDMHERQGRMQDLERNIDERIEMWERQQQASDELRSFEAAELRTEMARLKETSIEEISKLRTEVLRLQHARSTEPEMSQQRIGSSVFPKSTKSPSPSRTLTTDTTPPPSCSEASEVARLQAELELREESELAARQQIAQLQQEVDELRLLKQSSRAKDILRGH